MSYWYIAHPNELLLDLDDYSRPTKNGEAWGEVFFRRRLRSAILSNKLKVESIWLIRSISKKHFHAIIKLRSRMPIMERLVWQLHLGSDLYRGRADLMRACRGFPSPSLLIQPKQINEFYRKPDAVCLCTKKHKTEENPNCYVWRKYRGMSPWELFGTSSQKKEFPVILPIGKVPLELFTWRNVW